MSDFQPSASRFFGGQAVAVAYSGFREGQHPDRGEGEGGPSKEEILEDLQILDHHGLHLIRLYDSGTNSRQVLEVVREHELPFNVVLGVWLAAEEDSHTTCAWLDAPYPPELLAANRGKNAEELKRAIHLAGSFEDIVVAVNVGNENLVTWNDHLVSIDSMVAYLEELSSMINQPVTTADNYLAYVEHASRLREAVDFAFVHTYPVWEGKPVSEAMAYTRANMELVSEAMPGVPLAIGEAGWPSRASEFPDRAGPQAQVSYLLGLTDFARDTGVTTFVFEAFDEPWKGNPRNPDGAEKHWGLFDVHRAPKPAADLFTRSTE